MAESPSWGRYPPAKQHVLPVTSRSNALPYFKGHAIPRGNGRSYGDSCLDDGGTLLDARQLDRFIRFDSQRGILRCESGVLLSGILNVVVPRGWFLPVTPGTKFVTVGGAIANDVHGKNHHVAGNFGNHVLSLELLRSSGERMRCALDENPDWFAATVGGLGLTGLITWVDLQLKRIDGPMMAAETCRFDDLEGFFQLSSESEHEYEYTVAWVDCTATGGSLGRGVFSRANHSAAVSSTSRRRNSTNGLRVPFTPPFSLVNPFSVRCFNNLYFHRQPGRTRYSLEHYDPWFYPLDSLREWNRMYGPDGFLQYQCVVPPQNAYSAVKEVLQRIAASGEGSFLAVLKQFGSTTSAGMLSFPRAGTTLALDFANRGDKTFALLNRLDEVVASAGGAVYPAKDARMSGEHFRNSFPEWLRFRDFIDPRFSSGFWRRVME